MSEKTAENSQDFDIHIDSEGQWFHEGGLIRRPALVKLFATILSCDGAGQHWLTTPVEHGRITVADAAFVIIAMRQEDGAVQLTDNLEREWTLSAAYPLVVETRAGQQRPYLQLARGLRAKISRPVYYEMAAAAVENDAGTAMGLISEGQFFSLGAIDEAPSDG